MAFVYETERNLDFNKNYEENELGPGQYLPITDEKEIKENIIPFLSSEEKLKYKQNDNPGPGTYYRDITKEEDIKRKENKKMEIINKIDEIKTSNKILSPDDPETKKEFQAEKRIKKNYEKYGFSVKEKRFKTNENFIPGPGSFFNNKFEEEEKKTYEKIKNDKNKIKKNERKKKFKIENSQYNIDSIPQRISFGYETNKDGKIVKKDNPQKYKIFSGVEGVDTVGPGTYDIDLPEYWKKKGTFWSKNKDIRSYQEKKKIRPQTSLNVNHINCTQGNFREEENKNEKNLNNNENNNFYNGKNMNFLMNKSIYKNYNNGKNKIGDFNIIPKKEFSFVNNNNNPGPGTYFLNDNNSNSGFFNAAKKPKKTPFNEKNYFLSSTDRFGNGLNSPIESNIKSIEYDDYLFGINLKKIPIRDSQIQKLEKNKFNKKENIIKKKDKKKEKKEKKPTESEKPKIGFLSQSTRFPKSKLEKEEKENKNENIELVNKNMHKTIFTNKLLNSSFSTSQSSYNSRPLTGNGKFYRRDRRFREAENELIRLSENPGPGSYIDPFSNTGINNTIIINGRFVDLRTGNNIINENKRPKSSKSDFYKNERNKYVNYNNNPGVGKYDNGNFNSIKYLNDKFYVDRINYSKSNILGFDSSEIDKRCLKGKMDNLGPGVYYNQNFVKEFQVDPPFKSSCQRQVLDKKLKKNSLDGKFVGPGQYDIEECYPWVKQSFNIKYL